MLFIRRVIFFSSKKPLQNSSGNTMMYILASFLVVSFIGTAMMKVSYHDVMASSDYASTSSAEEAARSGLQATEAFFAGDGDSAVKILQSYIHTPKPYWILGDTLPANRVAISGQLSFVSELLSFSYDTNTSSDFIANVRSYGYGKGDSREIISSIVRLNNLDWGTSSDVMPMNALELGQGAGEIVAPLTVGTLADGGDVYVKNPNSYFVGAGAQHNFYGLFRTAEGSNIMKIKNAVFHKQAYFRVRVYNDGDANIFKNGVGFEKGYDINSPTSLVTGGNVFTNGTLLGTGNLLRSSGVDITRWSGHAAGNSTGGGNSYSETDSITNMQDRLLITTKEPPDLSFDISGIPPSLIYNINSLFSGWSAPTAADFNTAYGTKNLWNGFLVIKGKYAQSWNAIGSGGTFNGKVIWILENENPIYQSNGMFEIGLNAIFVFYLKNTTFGGPSGNFKFSNYFRGYIFTEGNASTDYHIIASNNTVIDGGMLFKDAIFRLEVGTGSMKIQYNQTVLNELSVLGLFEDDSPVTTDSLILTAPITTTELSIHF